MSIKKSIKALVISSTLLVLPLSVFAQIPQLPHIFYGDITINESSAPTGTVVIAKVGGIEKGRITTAKTGKYGGPGAYDQKLLIQGSDLQASNTIRFTVSGIEASETAKFESGKIEEKNLFFTIAEVGVSSANLTSLLDNGTLAVSGTKESAASLYTTQQVVINIATGGGASKVILPQGTTITRGGGGTFNADNLTANSATVSSLSGLGSGVVADGALQWGLPGIELQFSSPITVTIFIGDGFNGQTLDITRSTSGSSGWTNNGIVSPATCLVNSGECVFNTIKASYFLASHTVTVTTPVPSGGSNSGGVTIPTSPLSPAAQKIDTNKDNKIDILDFNTLMVNWGSTNANNSVDFNGDGKVNVFDFNLLMINWTLQLP